MAVLLAALFLLAGCSAAPAQGDADTGRLLALRVPGYEQLTVQEFRETVGELQERDPEFMDAYYAVMERLSVEPEGDALDEQDLRFITVTLKCTLDELTAQQQTRWSGGQVEPAYIRAIDLYRTEGGEEHHLFLDHSIVYTVAEPERMTVGERDRAVSAILEPLMAYLETEPIDSLTGPDIAQRLADFADGQAPIRPVLNVYTFMVDGAPIGL